MTSSLAGSRVFITGATGVIGSRLTRSLLDAGAYVVALIMDWDPQSELIRSGTVDRISVVNGQVEDFNTLERAINQHQVDTVFHLAAQAIVGVAYRSPLPTFEANIRGSYNLLEACRVHRDLVKRVVVASSDKAYGDSDTLPYTEDHPLKGIHPYDVSKSCADLIAHSYWATYELPVAIARCGNVYGGGDLNWSRIVPGTIRSLHRGERPVIRSDGLFTRDYAYVDDVVEAYKTLAYSLDERPEVRGEAFNFGPQYPCTVLEVVQEIADLMDRADLAPVILNQATEEIRDQHLSCEKAGRLLKWKPSYSLQDGLKLTIDWYKEFLSSR